MEQRKGVFADIKLDFFHCKFEALTRSSFKMVGVSKTDSGVSENEPELNKNAQ